MMTTSLVVGRSKPGYGLCPALNFKDLHHPRCGEGRAEPGPASSWAGDPVLPSAFGGEGHRPAVRRRRPPAMRGKANCCCRARVQLSVLHPGNIRATRGPATSRSSLRRRLHNTSYAARAVLVFWDSLVLVARTGVRTCRCALGRPPLAGAVLVGHLEFVVPQALWCGGCSYPREWNRSPVCNGTLSMGVCSLWLSRPEHLGI
jgi:hypothetical protein